VRDGFGQPDGGPLVEPECGDDLEPGPLATLGDDRGRSDPERSRDRVEHRRERRTLVVLVRQGARGRDEDFLRAVGGHRALSRSGSGRA
jgi:hypothetical protein